MRELCFWSVGDGPYALMMQTLVASYRAVGMTDDFHAFSDRPIAGAIHHPIGPFDKTLYLFKLRFLQSEVARLDYRYFAFLDADNYFVRKPSDLLGLMHKSPLHSFLESDCAASDNRRPDWWSCPLPEYVRLMRECGVTTPGVYNVNAGFFIVHRDAIEAVCRLACEFWEHAYRAGYVFTEEAPLAYATHMLCVDPAAHLMRNLFDVWSCDWTGSFAGRLPTGEDWTFQDYMTGAPHKVNPAIVHAMRSNAAMVRAAHHLSGAALASPARIARHA